MYTFVGSIVLRVVSQYAPGIMWDWHPFWWTTTFGWSTSIYADNWGFFWEVSNICCRFEFLKNLLTFVDFPQNTPAFLGAGVLTGVNASLSLYFGGIFFWGILGPMLIKTQTCVGRDFSSSYDGYMVWNYNKMKWANAQGTVSPRYWILFPAIFLMIVASFTELGCNGRSIYKGFSDLYKETVNTLQVRRGLGEKYVVDADIVDPAPDEDQVPLWAWAGGLVVVIILTLAVMAKAFDLEGELSFLSMGICFSVANFSTLSSWCFNSCYLPWILILVHWSSMCCKFLLFRLFPTLSKIRLTRILYIGRYRYQPRLYLC